MQAPAVPGWGGVVHCEIMQADPPHLLRYSWRGGAREVAGCGHFLDTVVTWELSPLPDGGTHLRMVHDGFRDEDSFAYQTMGGGWRTKIPQELAKVLGELG